VEIDEPLARVEDGLIEIGLFNVNVEAVEADAAVGTTSFTSASA
jgi:hypothetical protein